MASHGVAFGQFPATARTTGGMFFFVLAAPPNIKMMHFV